MSYVNGLGAAPAGWVATRLYDGDQLQVDGQPQHSLAHLYNISPQAIVSANGAAWSQKSINEWVLRTGGKMLSSGFAVFTSGSVIYLPAGGPRPAANAPVAPTPTPPPPPTTPPPPNEAGMSPLLIGAGVLLLIGAFASRKKKSSSSKG